MSEFGRRSARGDAAPVRASGGRKMTAIAVSAVVFALSAAAGAYLTRGAFAPDYSKMTAAGVGAELDKFAAGNPGAAAVFNALRERYPETYDRLTQDVAAALRRGDADKVNRIAFDSMRALSRAKAKNIAHASGPRLAEWARSGLALMVAARSHSPALCAQVAFGKIENLDTNASPALINAVGRYAAATIEAFYEGEQAPKNHPSMTGAEQRTLAAAVISQGIRQEDAPKLQSLAAVRQLPDREQCDLAIKMMRGVTITQEPARTRALAAMAAEAAKTM